MVNLNIQEVSEILGLCSFLRVPKHVFIANERVWEEQGGRKTFFRGLQPQQKHDSMLLSKVDADNSTPIHEAVHAYGFDEFGTEIVTRLIMKKNKALSHLPRIRELTKRNIKFTKVSASEEYPWAHQPKFQDRIDHFILN